MINDTIMQLVDHHGYVFFFLAFCLGPFGIPVPNEITILIGGILSNNGVLNPWFLYMFILTGLVTATTLAFIAGRIFGEKFKKKFEYNRHFQKAEKLLKQNGDIAMCLGFLIPVVRYILPLLVGLNGVSYKMFALISYSSAFVWTVALFTFGRLFGDHILNLIEVIDLRSAVIAALVVAVAGVIITKLFKVKHSDHSWLNEPHSK